MSASVDAMRAFVVDYKDALLSARLKQRFFLQSAETDSPAWRECELSCALSGQVSHSDERLLSNARQKAGHVTKDAV